MFTHTATINSRALLYRGPAASRIAPSSLIFAAVVLFVGAVSVYDGYLVLRTGDLIYEFERNPAGKWLIGYNGGDPSLFLAAKAVGTLLVLQALTVLYRRSQRLAYPTAIALFVFQSSLLVFLEFA